MRQDDATALQPGQQSKTPSHRPEPTVPNLKVIGASHSWNEYLQGATLTLGAGANTDYDPVPAPEVSLVEISM